MLLKDYLILKDENRQILKIDLCIIKNINEFLKFLFNYDSVLSDKIKNNNYYIEDLENIRNLFGDKIYDFIFEKIVIDENYNYNESFGLLFILKIKSNNFETLKYNTISELENIEFEEVASDLINNFKMDLKYKGVFFEEV